MEKPPTSFRSIPIELRLRILESTHLGPPDTGGYHKAWECLRIRDGKIVPWYKTLLTPLPWNVCFSPQTHGTSAQKCQCRVLPTQLYLVDRQMRHEAVEVFYSNAHFDLHGDNFSSSLSFLRDVLPRDGLSRLRRLEFTWTEAQCEGWADGAPPKFDYKNDWRAVVALLGAHADLPRLTITLSMEEYAWSLVYDTIVWDESPDMSMFRSIYDFHIDLATALCLLKGLGGVNLELGAFQQLRPWLEREVLGYERERIMQSHEAEWYEEYLWRPHFHQVFPPWHDVNRRLEESNYKPDPKVLAGSQPEKELMVKRSTVNS